MMEGNRTIYCTGCENATNARLTSGKEIYPHRRDLLSLPFWKCDACKNYVGCHHKTKNRTNPLGNIPTAELRKARGHIHKIIDPIWKSGAMKRGDLYRRMAAILGIDEYHSAEIKSIEDARKAYRAGQQLSKEINGNEAA